MENTELDEEMKKRAGKEITGILYFYEVIRILNFSILDFNKKSLTFKINVIEKYCVGLKLT